MKRPTWSLKVQVIPNGPLAEQETLPPEWRAKAYPKIQTVFKRDPATDYKTLLLDEYSLPEFEFLKDCRWEFSEKVNGINIRIVTLPSGYVIFDSKADRERIPIRLIKQLQELFPPHGKLAEQFPDGACLFGEGYGAGIKKGGGNYSPTQEFVLFDIRVNDWWLERAAVEDVAAALGISVVPVIARGNLHGMMVLASEGFDSEWGGFRAEGIVARPAVGLCRRDSKRIVCKLKARDFRPK